jgi:Rieske Fe-S protein
MFVKENAKVARHWIGDRLARTDARTIDSLAPGEGAIVSMHGERIAAHLDDAKTLHTLSPVCTHLACYVSCNSAEKTWDCPCHGSRFTGESTFIQGPAVRDLARARHPAAQGRRAACLCYLAWTGADFCSRTTAINACATLGSN